MRQGVGIVLSAVLATGAVAEVPIPVSPGGQGGITVVANRCPTFLWTAAAGGEAVELVVYRVPEGEAGGPPELLLGVTLPRSAQGWTPSLGQCLEPGRRYAWSVGVGGAWSEARLFEVASELSPVEVEETLHELRRFLEGGTSPPEVAPSRQEPRPQGQAAQATPRREQARRQTTRSKAGVATYLTGTTTPVPADPAPSLGDASLTVDEQVHLGANSHIFKDGALFLWGDGASGNLALGSAALEDNTTGVSNTALGRNALASNSTGILNTATGSSALLFNSSGEYNTATGAGALLFNTTGHDNTALGRRALYSNDDGSGNTAIGSLTLVLNTGGNRNTAVGYEALMLTEASQNTAMGAFALGSNTTGSRNVAIGDQALQFNTSGSSNTVIGDAALAGNTIGLENIVIGDGAGVLNPVDGSFNITIGSPGSDSDDHTLRLGREGAIQGQTRAFVAGIRGVTTDQSNAIPVLIDSDGQLGTASSSRSAKQDIREIGELSERLMELKPVAFRYRKHVRRDPHTARQFGLIAEEVAEVFPELVVYDAEDRPATVKYHLLSSLLLNELQKQHRQNRMQWLLIAGMMLAGLVAGTRWRFG